MVKSEEADKDEGVNEGNDEPMKSKQDLSNKISMDSGEGEENALDKAQDLLEDDSFEEADTDLKDDIDMLEQKKEELEERDTGKKDDQVVGDVLSEELDDGEDQSFNPEDVVNAIKSEINNKATKSEVEELKDDVIELSELMLEIAK